MPELTELIDALIAANREGHTVSAARFVDLSRQQAAVIQLAVAEASGGTLEAAKIGVGEDGAMVAAIPKGIVLMSGSTLSLSPRGLIGLEVEVAVRLSREIVAGSAMDAAECVGEIVNTIELIDTRLDDRTAAGPWGAFADAMVTGGLIMGTQALDAAAMMPDGLPITVTHDGATLYEGMARHPFGGVAAPLQVFAGRSAPGVERLPVGSVITTGSLTPLVPFKGPGRYEVRLGTYDPISVTLT